MTRRVCASVVLTAGLLVSFSAWPTPLPSGRVGPCRSAIQQAETGARLPSHLLGAIARVESGRPDRATGRVEPWPWTINAEGQGSFFETKAEAIAATRQLMARGVKSIDVGCMQVNLMYHPDAFRDLEEAFDPSANARYAVRFLTELRDKTGSWDVASTWYHSADPREGAQYRAKVVTAMAQEADDAGPAAAVQGEPPAWPMAAMPFRGLLAGRATAIMLPRLIPGAVLPRVALAGGSIGVPVAIRGLDSYRMQPVSSVKPQLTATR